MESLIGCFIVEFVVSFQRVENRGWRMKDGCLDPRSSINRSSSLSGLPGAPPPRSGKVEFQIVAFGIEHVNRIAAVAFDAAVKFADLLGGLERIVVIFPGHVEGLMKD